MAKKTWNVAIVGPGWVAGAYTTSFGKRDDVKVTHIVGRNKARAARFADTHGLDCWRHDDLGEALKDKSLDIVCVLTPHNLHAAQAIAAAKAGKNVIIEKPPCLLLKDLKAMRAAVKKARVKTIVGFVLHWNPLIKIIKQHIVEGNLGELIYAETDYLHGIVGKGYTKPWHTSRKTGGSSMLLAGCHAVDAIRFLVGRKVVEVTAYSTSRTTELEYPGTEIALLKFDNGTIGKVGSCLECNMPYVFNVEVYGTQGSFRNNQLAGDMFPGQTGFATVPTILPDSADVSHHPFDGEVDHFIDCLNRKQRPVPDLEDAAQSIEICLAAELSAKQGKPIKLPLK